ncbi:MAG TPA: class I SAM-dependent methyltransferase [Sedimentibacter sp.]|nr:class I SAM-dependent methyltransferase [Sedimentibacter sp.]HQB62790.1 class I SAM-dependent methyltransferase [Sedimentibacter sp.]
MKDLYEKFAYDYDEFGQIDEYLGDEKTFLNEIFTEHGVKNVLDCACGTGQHLYMLAQSGYNVWGSDYSKSMLEVARKNLQKRDYDIPLHQCDFRFLEQKFDMTFDAIVCLTTALPHLHTDEDLLTALRSMKNRLNKNGLLVLTQGTTHFTLTLPSIEVVVNRPDFSRIFVKEHNDRFQTIHVLDLFHNAQRLESNQYDIVYRILLDEDYKRLLSQAGFTNVQIYGDYNMKDYNENSWRLIVVAEALPD